MLTRIEALNYRSLRYISQEVSGFQTLVGPNGSGKSTFLDVVGFLGDLLRVGPYRAIMGDGNGTPQRAADLSHLTWMRAGKRFELAVELAVPESRRIDSKYERARYAVALEGKGESNEITLASETLWLKPCGIEEEPQSSPPTTLEVSHGWRQIVSKDSKSDNYSFLAENLREDDPSSFIAWFVHVSPNQSAFANLPEDEKRYPVATWVKRFLMRGIQKVMLNVQAMRRPSSSGAPRHFLPDGSNLPWVVQALKDADESRFSRWINHVQTAIPDLKTVSTVTREEDNSRYIVVEYKNGLKAPSWVISDGTLRVLALTLLAYINAEGVFLIEEPENGIHPKAIEAIYQSLSSVYDAQVLCASHSPIMLSMAEPADLLCFTKSKSGETIVVRGDEHPRLKRWKESTLDLGTLFAAGVLE